MNEAYEIKELTIAELSVLIDNVLEKHEDKYLGKFYAYDNLVDMWVTVDNSQNDCWVEEFDSKENALRWLKRYDTDIKCSVCDKVIGEYSLLTYETIKANDDYNTCDICGKEICFDCSFNYNIEHNDIDNYGNDWVIYEIDISINGCKKCIDKLKEE